MALSTLPIDTTNLQITVANKRVSPKNVFDPNAEKDAPKVQAFDAATGKNLWNVELQILDTKNEAISIERCTFAADTEPAFTFGETVKVDNFRVVPYSSDSGYGVNMSFKADTITGSTTSTKSKSKASSSSEYTAV